MSDIQTQQPESANAATATSNATAKAKQVVNSALTPGWTILVLGVGGYMLSETRIVGPLLSIVLAMATIYQLNQYITARQGKLL